MYTGTVVDRLYIMYTTFLGTVMTILNVILKGYYPPAEQNNIIKNLIINTKRRSQKYAESFCSIIVSNTVMNFATNPFIILYDLTLIPLDNPDNIDRVVHSEYKEIHYGIRLIKTIFGTINNAPPEDYIYAILLIVLTIVGLLLLLILNVLLIIFICILGFWLHYIFMQIYISVIKRWLSGSLSSSTYIIGSLDLLYYSPNNMRYKDDVYFRILLLLYICFLIPFTYYVWEFAIFYTKNYCTGLIYLPLYIYNTREVTDVLKLIHENTLYIENLLGFLENTKNPLSVLFVYMVERVAKVDPLVMSHYLFLLKIAYAPFGGLAGPFIYISTIYIARLLLRGLLYGYLLNIFAGIARRFRPFIVVLYIMQLSLYILAKVHKIVYIYGGALLSMLPIISSLLIKILSEFISYVSLSRVSPDKIEGYIYILLLFTYVCTNIIIVYYTWDFILFYVKLKHLAIHEIFIKSVPITVILKYMYNRYFFVFIDELDLFSRLNIALYYTLAIEKLTMSEKKELVLELSNYMGAWQDPVINPIMNKTHIMDLLL